MVNFFFYSEFSVRMPIIFLKNKKFNETFSFSKAELILDRFWTNFGQYFLQKILFSAVLYLGAICLRQNSSHLLFFTLANPGGKGEGEFCLPPPPPPLLVFP